MNLTDNELKKIYELCSSDDVVCDNNCPLIDETNCTVCIAKTALDLINRKDAQITELTEENEDIKRIVGLMNKRQYYRKFVDEVFRKQKGKELTDPDFDYIYHLYFEQKAEIERLTNKLEQREEMMANLGVELTTMRGAANSYKMHYEKAQAEIEKLQKHNEMVLENCRIFNKGVEEATNKRFLEAIDVVKTEAIKEFAERLKNEFVQEIRVYNGYASVKGISKNIDNLVKEMVGE